MDYPLLLGGKELFTDSVFEVKSPYDGKLVGRLSAATEDIVERSAEIAHSAFDETKSLRAAHREDILLRAKRLLDERADDFARMIVAESGKTIREARGEVGRAGETLTLSAALTREPLGEVLPFDTAPNGAQRWGFYQRFPSGPVLAITPFNFPLNLALHKIAPAVAVGNPFILKPASQTPITGLMLGKLIVDAGYPADGVSVLPGSGAIIGEKLALDKRIKVVTFTGSAPIGKKLAHAVGMKYIAMELGSNSAAIVLSDADIFRAADRITKGAVAVAGQVCISTQSAYVEEPIFDTLCEHIVSAMTKLKLGDPADEYTDVGPMISEYDIERIESWLADAVMSGAKILCGGKRQGTILEPTVIINVPQDAALIQKEAFAPVLVINKVGDLGEAIEFVNDSVYGLQAGIFTRDIIAARKAFDEIDVGGVIVNDVPTFRADLMPYGGVKDSGLGREGPQFALEHMTYLKVFAAYQPENE